MVKDNKDILNVQPHSHEAEQALLGCMLTSKDAVNIVYENRIKSEYFYKNSHSLIFSAMNILNEKQEPIDTVSFVDVLTKSKDLKNAGGAYYISGLVELVPTTAHVQRYIKIVLEKSILIIYSSSPSESDNVSVVANTFA